MQINLHSGISTLSYGVVGLNILRSLSKLGHDLVYWPIGHIEAIPPDTGLINQCIQNQVNVNKNSPCLKVFHEFDLCTRIGSGKYGTMSFFEIDRLDARRVAHLNCSDIIFCPSTWAKKVMEESGVKPEKVICHPGVDTNLFRPKPLQNDEVTRFCSIGKWEVRKSFQELATAFEKAFLPEDKVELYIAADNPFFPEEENQAWRNIFIKSKLGSKVKFINRSLDQGSIVDLINHCDCLVSPSKAEGFNLPALEALACGRHVITTNYSAMPDFCDDKNSMLINIDKTQPCYDGHWFTPESIGDAYWAYYGQNQIDQLINYMRGIHKQKQYGELKINEYGSKTGKEFSWDKTTKIISSNLGD